MDEEMLIHLVSPHGTGYDTDNRDVWHEIHNYYIGTTSYDWIRDFESNKDERSAWLTLLQNDEGPNSEKKRIIQAIQSI